MELDDDQTKLMHRTGGTTIHGVWVIALVIGLWILSIAFYTPVMP